MVTFTNAAASEMRQRILDAIYRYLDEHPEDSKMQEQIVKMAKSNICTIHSFCLDVIRNHFYEIGISPNIRVGNENEMELLKRQVLEEIFEKKYEKEDKAFLMLIDTYTNYKTDEPLKELILNITKIIRSNPFPEEWLTKAVEDFYVGEEIEDFAKTKWGEILLEEIKEELQMCILELEKIKKELAKFYELDKFKNTIEYDIQNLKQISCNLDSWDKAFAIATTLKWQTWPRDKIEMMAKEVAKDKRDQVKKKWNKIKDKFFICNSNQIHQDRKDMYEKLVAIKDLVDEFYVTFAKEKLEKNVMDFQDIEHFALKILVKTDEQGNKKPTEIALSYQETFKEIAIDEYQDSNLIQEYLLNTISKGNNIFMVGDVKQSIYKFRQARPELFLQKYETYRKKEQKTPEDSLKIQLFKNFRSRKNVLEVTNYIFETIMSKELGDIIYNEEEYLNVGANYPELESILPNVRKTSLQIVDLKQKDNEEGEVEQVENAVLEARLVAKQIQSLVKNKFQVYDKQSGYRDICYRDIVILLRSTAMLAPIYEKELTTKAIPVFSDTSSQYFDSIEIQTILSLLKIIDNPMQDIPFVSVLRSPIGEFDDNELIVIKLNGNEERHEYFYETFQKAIQKEEMPIVLKQKMEKFLNKLNSWRQLNEYMPLDEFIWQIYLDTGYYQYVGLMSNGSLRQANLKVLFERAKEYEKASFKGLFNFIDYMNQLKRISSDMDAAKVISENEDVVRIMSIHKSKGLEFPVVILASSAKKFNLMDVNKPILLHQDLGIGPKYIDETRKIEYPTIIKLAIGEKTVKETLSEEMRILYVALTRAKEKLIITGVSKDFEKEIELKKEKLELRKDKTILPNIKQYKSYLDWILLVYLKDEEKAKEIIELKIHQKQDLQQIVGQEGKHNTNALFFEQTKDDEIKEELKKKLEWEYPYQLSCYIPTMMSVSKIKEVEMRNQSQDILMLKGMKQDKKWQEKKIPEFLKEEVKVSKAKIGSIIHLCLQKLNEKEDYDLEKIESLVESLVKKQLITKKEAQAIRLQDLYLYTQSNLFNSLKQAKEIYKETPFYFDMQAKEVMHQEVEEKILVQGIIDLYYIDKDNHMILVDYKTDFVKQEGELILKYQKQLEIYKRALEEATGRKVHKVGIYSIYLQKLIILPCLT